MSSCAVLHQRQDQAQRGHRKPRRQRPRAALPVSSCLKHGAHRGRSLNIIAVATVHQRLFTTPRTTTGWNQSTGRTAWNQSTQARPPEPLIFGRGLLLHTNPVSSSARPQSGEKGAVVAIGELPKFYVEFNCLDHEDIAQSFKFDSRLRIGPRAPKALVRLFKPIVWSRSIWPVYHEFMPEALPVP